jgi:hypothetical protein
MIGARCSDTKTCSLPTGRLFPTLSASIRLAPSPHWQNGLQNLCSRELADRMEHWRSARHHQGFGCRCEVLCLARKLSPFGSWKQHPERSDCQTWYIGGSGPMLSLVVRGGHRVTPETRWPRSTWKPAILLDNPSNRASANHGNSPRCSAGRHPHSGFQGCNRGRRGYLSRSCSVGRLARSHRGCFLQNVLLGFTLEPLGTAETN